MSQIINLNRLPDFVISDFAKLDGQRVVSIALPLLALNSHTAGISSVGAGLYQCYTLYKDKKTKTSSKWINAALLVSSAALGYYFPRCQLIFSSGVFFISHGHKLFTKGNKTLTIFQISNQTLHLASRYYKTPLLTAASLVSQAANELIQAYQEKKTPERCLNLLLAAFRLYGAYQYLPQKAPKASPVNPEPKPAQNAVEKTVREQKRKSPNPSSIKPPLSLAQKPTENYLTPNPTSGKEDSQPVETSAPSEPVVQQPLRKMTQQEWDAFTNKHPEHFSDKFVSYGLSKPTAASLFDIRSALQKEGWFPELEGLTFSKKFVNCHFSSLKFKNCVFDSISFSRCLFDQVSLDQCSFKLTNWRLVIITNSQLMNCNFYQASFEGHEHRYFSEFFNADQVYTYFCELSNLKISNCNFEEARFDITKIIHSQFDKSSFIETWFKGCEIENATLKKCDLSKACIQASNVKNLSLQQVDLRDTHWIESAVENLNIQQGKLFQCVFFRTRVNESQLIDCDLENALLLDAKTGFKIHGGIPHQITKPIIALGWGYDETGSFTQLIRKALADQGALVIRYPQTGEVSESLLREVTNGLEKTIPSEQSIAEQLLNNAAPNSELDLIKQRASALLSHAEGLVIPGGEDIEPCFYRPGSPVSKIKYKSLIELALIAEADRQKVPTLGTCRGAQMINVYFGGTLKDVDDQHDDQLLEWTTSPLGNRLRMILPMNFIGYSAHDQAADKIGRGLNLVLKYEEVPKLLISDDGNFIASQFHPETYIGDKQRFEKTEIFRGRTLDQIQEMSSSETKSKIRSTFDEMLRNMPTKTAIEQAAKDLMAEFYSRSIEMIENLDKDIRFVLSNRDFYTFFMEKVTNLKTISIMAAAAG